MDGVVTEEEPDKLEQRRMHMLKQTVDAQIFILTRNQMTFVM